jgi:hypothetical protein
VLIEKLQLLGKATRKAGLGLVDARLHLEEGEEKESISEDDSGNNLGAVRVKAQDPADPLWRAMRLKRSKHPMSSMYCR